MISSVLAVMLFYSPVLFYSILADNEKGAQMKKPRQSVRAGAGQREGGLRRSSVVYTTETADGGLRPPQPVMSPEQPGIGRFTSTPQGVDMADGGSKPPQPMAPDTADDGMTPSRLVAA